MDLVLDSFHISEMRLSPHQKGKTPIFFFRKGREEGDLHTVILRGVFSNLVRHLQLLQDQVPSTKTIQNPSTCFVESSKFRVNDQILLGFSDREVDALSSQPNIVSTLVSDTTNLCRHILVVKALKGNLINTVLSS